MSTDDLSSKGETDGWMVDQVPYADLSAEQRLRALWHSFTDADPVPPEFPEDMEAAGLAELVPVTEDALEDPFAWDRGIYPGGMMWQLTEAGRSALSLARGQTPGASNG